MLIPAIAEDGSLYPVEKLKAHIDGVLHLAVSIFVFDGDSLLIQKRSDSKYHCPGLWANTCCTHPNWGESVESCAQRRLGEELGFSLPLTRHETVEYRAPVGSGLTEHERVTLFTAHASRDSFRIKPDPTEVSQTRWINTIKLQSEIDRDPDEFTPWFRIYSERYPAMIFQS